MATSDGRLYEWTDAAGMRWREISTEAGNLFRADDESFGENGWHLIHPDGIGHEAGDSWMVICRRRVEGDHGETIYPPGDFTRVDQDRRWRR